MKTIITIVFILISSVCYGHEPKLIDMTGIVINKSDVFTRVVCLEGYKYVILYMKNGLSITQMMKKSSYNTNAEPIKCKE